MVVCTGLGSLLQPGLAIGYASGFADRAKTTKSEGEIERGNFCWCLYRGQRGNWREIERRNKGFVCAVGF